MINLGIAFDIAGPAVMIVLIIIGAMKAWPYRKTDSEKFRSIYKPYKYWGLGIWIVFNIIGILLIYNAWRFHHIRRSSYVIFTIGVSVFHAKLHPDIQKKKYGAALKINSYFFNIHDYFLYFCKNIKTYHTMNIWIFLPILGGIVGAIIGGRAYKNYQDRHK